MITVAQILGLWFALLGLLVAALYRKAFTEPTNVPGAALALARAGRMGQRSTTRNRVLALAGWATVAGLVAVAGLCLWGLVR